MFLSGMGMDWERMSIIRIKCLEGRKIVDLKESFILSCLEVDDP